MVSLSFFCYNESNYMVLIGWFLLGMYLNLGFETFRKILSARIYVDKTMMIAEINRMMGERNNKGG